MFIDVSIYQGSMILFDPNSCRVNFGLRNVPPKVCSIGAAVQRYEYPDAYLVVWLNFPGALRAKDFFLWEISSLSETKRAEMRL